MPFPFRLFLRIHKRRFAALQPLQNPTNSSSNFDLLRLKNLRNIGISAHIDSGKTTLTERILYYTGKINDIHEVRGKDQVGAKMDSMELEREKGITIQSAATFTQWKDCAINIIDTPGHVDFTIEVERALRVLDGAVLVLCAVGGVQSQTITVDRQMKRYKVPRICFINKMDRQGANPNKILEDLKKKLKLNCAMAQIPIGQYDQFKGVVDLVDWKAYYNTGEKGIDIEVKEIPKDLIETATAARLTLFQTLADIDEEMTDLFLNESIPTNQNLKDAIRRQTITQQFCPVFVGSAYHNKAVQPLLDGVLNYLPTPDEIENHALDILNSETPVVLSPSSEKPFIGLAFKLEEGRYGQLTYIRVYQGTLKKGQLLYNVRTKKKVKVPRLVRMHSNEMEDVDEVRSGEICAMFGIECASGDTFSDGVLNYTMTTMFVPNPVISLSIVPKGGRETPNFSKALQRFQREDPTFKVHVEAESKETIVSGMGELHLEIYVERMRREYNVETVTGKPRVAFRETISKHQKFSYTHKKQTGGSGQYAKIEGYVCPLYTNEELLEFEETDEKGQPLVARPNPEDMIQFCNETVGMNIPSGYIPAIEKGFKEMCAKGSLTGSQVTNMKFVLEDGLSHQVDSSELAFKICTMYAFREVFLKAAPLILQPLMSVSVSAPCEYQGPVIALLNKRKGSITNTEVQLDYVDIEATVALNDMFGFSTDLRSISQGKGEFSMEYFKHDVCMPQTQADLIEEYQKKRADKIK